MRVAVVDDEQWIVAGLKKIIERQYPDFQVYTFTDPLEAASQMTADMPDLLITDIRMPQLSGMELIARMREAGLRYYAVLTGLNDVPLFQESIRMQVSDYLIKPVNKIELFALIDRVVERLRQQRQAEDARLTDQIRLCAQYGDQAADAALLRRFHWMLLTVTPLPEELERYFSTHVELQHDGQTYLLYLREQETDIPSSQVSENTFFAPFAPETLRHLVDTFDAAQKDEISHLVSQYVHHPGDEKTILCLLELLHAGKCTPEALTRFARLTGKQLMLWDACKLAVDAHRGELTAPGLAETLHTLPDLPMPRSKDAMTVLAYIEQHYTEEITLAQAAASVYLQANYFTTLFKKEMGVGFVQYLNQYRVESACLAIIEQDCDSFAQIAQEAGFVSQRHFFATFKKYTGQTPGAFRQALKDAGLLSSTGSHRVQTVP